MNSLTLIGMPASGKTTIGKMLAQREKLNFIDTDDLVRDAIGQPIAQYLGEYQSNINKFRQIEEDAILSICTNCDIISTGGSVVYSEKAMQHLKSFSLICYLDVSLKTIEHRIPDPLVRGVLMGSHGSLYSLYYERQPLYTKYADLIIEESSMEKMTQIISALLH